MPTLRFKTNLNCGNCVAAVKPHLDGDPGIARWEVDTKNPNKVLTVEGDNVVAATVEQHVAAAGFRVLGALDQPPLAQLQSADKQSTSNQTAATADDGRSWLETYKPLLLIVGYLLGVVALVEVVQGGFDWMRAMGNFMGGFFLAFSFFKLLNLSGFVDAFQTYDIVARPVRAYGYLYPFIELALGVAYIARLAPVATNVATLVVMVVGSVGVAQALLKKQQIQCACLGSVFNLPMSKVTFIEDALMGLMAAAMLVAEFSHR